MIYASLFDRLCAHVEVEDFAPYCWTWTGATRRHGGGHRPSITMRPAPGEPPKRFNAARVMCEIVHGPAPEDHDASHLCEDSWLCINPDHVLWETKAENQARCTARRRAAAMEIDVYDRGEITEECPF